MAQLHENHESPESFFNDLPSKIAELYSFLEEKVKLFQTFDFLSYISYYNHLHNSDTYSDFREDKHFFVSEVLALLCLKNGFQEVTIVTKQDFLETIMQLQKATLEYCMRVDAHEHIGNLKNNDLIIEINNKIQAEGKQIRNPGLPDHHLIFAEKIFDSIKSEVLARFGFSISDAVRIRKLFHNFINERCEIAIKESLSIANKYSKEIIEYKRTNKIKDKSNLSIQDLEQYASLTENEIRTKCKGYCLNEMFFTFGKIIAFSREELEDYTGIDSKSINHFLNLFSCKFPSLSKDESIYNSFSLLRTKPILEHEGKYLVPSYPMLTWCVEEVLEDEIKTDNKLLAKFQKSKHDFLLNQGLEFFRVLFPTHSLIESNLFYRIGGDRYETDGLIIFDKVLFIIEAKSDKITTKAKKGHIRKTEDHLKSLVRDSYKQASRTIEYLENNFDAKFETSDGRNINISQRNFDQTIIVSLTLEPIGNLSMHIKATNELGYFNDKHFPWIVSIYDLAIIVDLFDNPILLLHYIKRRHKFLKQRTI